MESGVQSIKLILHTSVKLCKMKVTTGLGKTLQISTPLRETAERQPSFNSCWIICDCKATQSH